mmetsp:Transcript_13587/g.32419  ORF Transcript_13587/g.32419 Transcript_13587/m.32419 type:complete len:352 (-) Transcript_13587:41-1096(-)
MSLAPFVNPVGFALFRHLASKPENVLVSPLSISVCLSMVAAGVTPGSQTEKELVTLLGGEIPSLPAASTIQMANSAWVRMAIRQDYIDAVQTKFGAAAHDLPGVDPTPINKWVSEKTSGQIPVLFDSPLPDLTVMVLVNTVFFKGSWASVFDTGLTKKSNFQGFGATRPCDMMYKKEKGVSYTENDDFQAVQLPYSDGDTRATIILPKRAGPEDFAKVAAFLEEKSWSKLNASWREQEVELRLPRFRVSAGGSMVEVLRKLGLKDTFDANGGFLQMSDDPLVHLSEVMHKATVEVNEEGTVAAAATGAVMQSRCLPPPAVPMTVDRPFIFLLSDGKGAILFVGQFVEPEFV